MDNHEIKWLVDKHVVISKVYKWDAAGLAKDILEVDALINKSNLPLVHTIWDFQNLEEYPKNLNDIRKAVQPLFTNQRLGWVITVMQNQMIAFLSQAATSMYSVRYRTFKTMDEALEFIQKQDPTLPSLK